MKILLTYCITLTTCIILSLYIHCKANSLIREEDILSVLFIAFCISVVQFTVMFYSGMFMFVWRF